MRFHPVNPARTAACNDNGTMALVRPHTAPRDVLGAARLICGPVSLLYVAQGSLLMSAAPQREIRASAA
jgi:hypothetical protein